MAYVLLVERVDRTAQSEIIVAAVAGLGGEKVDIPDPDERRAAFDAALDAEPEYVDPEQAEFMEALGLRRGGDAR